jgi:transposase
VTRSSLSSACPACGTFSSRVHSRYLRKLRDLPWEKLSVVVILETRKFFCSEASCRRTIFTEQLPRTVARYSRHIFRLAEALNWITLAAGGQAGSRLAQRLGLLASGSTLRRQVRRRIRTKSAHVPRVLGSDDWAWRKGHRYGTILCDLEKHRVIDLLPDREADTVAAWLKQHPGVEIISRDRGGIYAEAARRAAPQAIQVADRWHLLSNMSEALRIALESHRRVMTEVSKASSNETTTEVSNLTEPDHRPSIKKQTRQRRYDLYRQVRGLLDASVSQSDVARQLDISLRTVQRWVRVGAFPERTPRHYPHSAEPYDDYLNQRLREGCRNVTQLF